MRDSELLEPANLENSDKEIYVENLERSMLTLSGVLSKNSGNESSLTGYVKQISRTMNLFRYTRDQENPSDNTGIYKELKIDPRYGFPTLEEIVLFSSKAATAEKELKRLGKKSNAAQKTADVLLNWDPSEKGLNEITRLHDTIREINFFQRLTKRDYADLPEGVSSKITEITLVEETDRIERFALFYAAWDIAKGFFSAYSIILDDDKEKYLRIGPDKPGHIFKSDDDSAWKVSDEVRSILVSSFGLHPQNHFGALNSLEGIHPKEIRYLGIEGFESRFASRNFKEIINRHNNAGILVATVITLTGEREIGEGKTRQTKFDMEKDADASLHIICSEETNSELIEYYKHNKHIDFTITPY